MRASLLFEILFFRELERSHVNFPAEDSGKVGGFGLMRKAILRCAALVAFVHLMTMESSAAVIFQENWNSGIAPANWTLFGGSGGAFTFDLGLTGQGAGGDSALFLRDASFTYGKGVRSTSSFSRAAGSAGLKVSFKLFHDRDGLLDYTSVGGPWANLGTPSATLPFLEDIEAGISTNQPNQQTYYVEDAPGVNDWVQNPLSAAFKAAFAAATTKAKALNVTVTVGNPSGARIQWSLGAGPTTVEYDTLGKAAGTSWTALVPPLGTPGNASTVSDASPIWLSFGGVANGTSHAGAIVDDIVVETIPEPTSGLLLAVTLGAWAARRSRRAK